MRIEAAFLILAVTVSAPALGQASHVPEGEMKTTAIAPGMAVLSYGNMGNVGVSYGTDGILLVDDMYAALTPKILLALRPLEDKAVRIVVNTHWHHDHSEGNANFARAGAVVVAQANVRMRMAAQQYMAGLKRNMPPSPPEALRTVTFDQAMTLHFNGETLNLIHFPKAHTDGDTMVYWSKANVLQMGDLFNRVTFPYLGLNEGGSIDGAIAAATKGISLCDGRTRVIPGHGEVGTRQDLVAYRDMLLDIRNKVAAGIARHRSLAEIVATKPAERYGMRDAFIKPDLFVELVYDSLKGLTGAEGLSSAKP